jgi:hypothetical protein
MTLLDFVRRLNALALTILLLLCVLLIVVLASPAHAQGVTVIADKPGWLEISGQYLNELAKAAATIFVPLFGYFIVLLAKRFKVELGEKAEAALNKALADGAQAAIAKYVDPTKPIQIDFKNELVAKTLAYAADHAKDTGLTPQIMAEKAEAQIATILPTGALNGATPAGGVGAATSDPLVTAEKSAARQ